MATAREVAIRAAKEAGAFLMEQRGKHTIIDKTILNPSTEEDETSERIIGKIISESFPDHGLLGEEFGERNHCATNKWIIDPIDGTNNFIDGRDTFSVSIGYEEAGVIVLGVVYLPARNELFVAEKGGGTTLNGEPIRIKGEADLAKAVVTYSTYPGLEEETANLDKSIFDQVPKVKFFSSTSAKDATFGGGSMAAEFCYLACGRIDGLIRLRQKPWDVAGGAIIALEAGAVMVDLKGEKCSVYTGDYVAGSEELVKKLLGLVK